MSAIAAGIVLKAGAFTFGQDIKRSSPALDFQLPYAATQDMLFHFTRTTFEPYVNGIFRVRAGKNAVNMTLVNVRDCTPNRKSMLLTKKSRRSDCFALEFRATGKLTDLTTIYNVEHGALGTFALFMTRRDGPRGIYFYEAVFNHAL